MLLELQAHWLQPWVVDKKCSTPAGIMGLAESIIQLAIADIARDQSREQAVSWIENNDTSYQFSFLNVCSLIQVDPKQIRGAVNAFLAENPARPKRRKKI